MIANLGAGDLAWAAGIAGLGGAGLFLLLPHRHGVVKARWAAPLGIGLCAAALGLVLGLLTPPSALMDLLFTYAFGALALAAGAAMITARDPLHSALWFATVVLSTSGLFLLAGAQFLAAGTVIVYAGAIIVMFLFVIMLAQQEGRASYDRMSRNPRLAATTTAVLLLGVLSSALATRNAERAGIDEGKGPGAGLASRAALISAEGAETGSGSVSVSGLDDRKRAILASLGRSTDELPKGSTPARAEREFDEAEGAGGGAALIPPPSPRPLPPPHVASMGATLYNTHLIAVGIAAALLFAAMVGAVAITVVPRRERPPHPEL